MAQQTINVGSAPNDGLGDAIRTAFTKSNSNFTELYSRAQTSPPSTLVGTTGDVAGMYAYDSSYFYYCFANYDGSSTIWAQVTQVGNITTPQIVNGNSNVDINTSGGPITIGANGTANVFVIDDAAANIAVDLNVSGDSTFTGNITAANIIPSANITYDLGNSSAQWRDLYLSGNSIFLGDATISANANTISLITGTGTEFVIGGSGGNSDGNFSNVSATGNITGGNVIADSSIIANSATINGNANVSGNLSISNAVSVTGNITTDSYFIGTFIGNITGNFVVPGANTEVLYNTNGNADASSDFTFTSGNAELTVSGNVVGGNVKTGGNVSAAGTVTGTTFIGAVASSTTISSTGNVTGGNILTGGLISAAGNITGGNLVTLGTFESSSISSTGNVDAANVNVSGLANVVGNVEGGNVTTVGQVSATGNVTGNYFLGNGFFLDGIDTSIISNGTSNVSVAVSNGNITVGVNGTANVIVVDDTGGNVTGTWQASSTITGGNINTAGVVSATGNVTGGNILTGGLISATGAVTGTQFNGNLAGTTVSASGNVTGGNILTGGLISAGGTVTGTTFVGAVASSTTVSATGNITGGNIITSADISAASVSASGNITGGNLITAGVLSVNSGNAATAIVNDGGNAVGNIGSSSKYFNTVFATATTALYADLAENYLADADYPPGTVVTFGGNQEVTVSMIDSDTAVAGVVSSAPAYSMNEGLQGDHVCKIALMGRVPCKVKGTVKKGSLMVSAGDGHARACESPQVGTVIGKSLENFDGETGIIEIVVGRV